MTTSFSPRWLCASVMVLIAAACGPALIGAGIGSISGGDPPPPPPQLALMASPQVTPLSAGNNCGLRQDIAVSVNLSGVDLTYSLNGASPIALPQLAANQPGTVTLVLEPRVNTVVFTGSVNTQNRTQTLQINKSGVDPVRVELQTVGARDTSLTLAWPSLPGVERYRVYTSSYDPAQPPTKINELGSPVELDASALAVTGGRYEHTVANLTTGPSGEMQWYAMAIRADDGCESPIVIAHTRPRSPRSRWTEHPNPSFTIEPPMNNIASVLLADRGGDPGGQGPDAALDVLTVDRDGILQVIPNLGAEVGYGAAISTQEGLLRPTILTNPIQAHTMRYDGDLRPDVFICEQQMIWTFGGDPNGEWVFKQLGSGIPLPSALPAGAHFRDMRIGDFDGDGSFDVAASVAAPQSTLSINVWYSAANVWGAGWSWSSAYVIPVGTAWPQDAHFSVSDIDRDGHDDIIVVERNAQDSGRYVVHRMASRFISTRSESATFNPNLQSARWDETGFADINTDGYLDLICSRTSHERGWASISGYLFDPSSAAFDVSQRFFDLFVGPAHPPIAPASEPPTQRGHFALLDVDEDGLLDLVFRRIWNGSRTVSDLRVWRGQRGSLGSQDFQLWQDLSWSSFSLAKPHLHFAAGDLNHDGIIDFCSLHEDGNRGVAAVLESTPEWAWQRDVQHFDRTTNVMLGTAAPHDPEPANLDGRGDVFLGVSSAASSGRREIGYLPARRDAGDPVGGFDLPSEKNADQLPVDALWAAIASGAGPTSDVTVLLQDGEVGQLISTGSGYEWRPSITLTNPDDAWLIVGNFDRDPRADALVVETDTGILRLLSTSGGSLQERETLSLSRTPELAIVDDLTGNGLDDVVIVLAPSGSVGREILLRGITLKQGQAIPGFEEEPAFISPVPVATQLTSLTVAPLDGTVDFDQFFQKWVIAGTTDGDIIAFDNIGILLPPTTLASLGPNWKNTIVHAADVTYDGLPDIIAVDPTRGETKVFRAERDTTQLQEKPWLVKGTGDVVEHASWTVPVPLAAVNHAFINDDPYPDLMFLSADRRQILFWSPIGAQQ